MKVLICVLLSVLTLSLKAQEAYYVLIVKGKMYNANHNMINVGDKLRSNEKLKFTTKNDFIIAINTKGTYEINPGNKKSDSELFTVLIKDNIRLQADNNVLGSRAIGDEISIENYFKPTVVNGKEVNDKILIVDELKVPLKNMGYYKIDNNKNFFFLQLVDTNKKVWNRKLTVKDDTLLLEKDDFIFDGQQYSSQTGILELGFVKDHLTEKQVVKKITKVNPVFLSKEELMKFIKGIKLAFPDKSKSDVVGQVYSRLYYLYGKPDEQLIEDLY